MNGYTIDPFTWHPVRYHSQTVYYLGKKWVRVKTSDGSGWTVVFHGKDVVTLFMTRP